MTLGERIYRLRADRNMTQEQLAEKLGVTRQSISKWEGDLVKPEIEKLKAMAKLFEVSLDDLISDETAETKTTKADGFERNVTIYKFVSIITAGICLVMIVIMIAVAVNMSNRIKALELRGPEIIYQNTEDCSDEADELFSDVSWKIKSPDFKNQKSKLHIEAEPRIYSDSTGIMAVAEADNGKQYTAALENSNGRFGGDITIPISGEQMKISLVVENDGQKQKVTIAEDIYMIEGITVLPEIEIYTGNTKGNTYTGSISVNIGENEIALAENIKDIKVFVRNGNKVIFEKSVSTLPDIDMAEYSFKGGKVNWEKDFEAAVSYYDKNIGRTVEIYGMFDPTVSYDPAQSEKIGVQEYSYDDNYHITLK